MLRQCAGIILKKHFKPFPSSTCFLNTGVSEGCLRLCIDRNRSVRSVLNYSIFISQTVIRDEYCNILRRLSVNKFFFLDFGKLNMSSDTSNRNVDYYQLVELMNKGNVTVIDVREKNELKETGEIPGSLNIPLGELSNALNKMNDEEFKNTYGLARPSVEDTVIFSCRSGRRSLMALEEAVKTGYKNSLNFTGGWLDWEEKTSPK